MKRYRVALDGWLNGRYTKVGETVILTPDGAQYLVMSGQIEEAREDTAATVPPPAKRARRSAKAKGR